MKRFQAFTLDRSALAGELAAFQRLLKPADRELSEGKDVLPFFKKNRNLASLLGSFNSHLVAPDVIKTEFELFGEHACDLAVGETQSRQFCFVEFEDARRNSIFNHGSKGSPDWATRLEHGFSQIVDWFHTLAGQAHSSLFSEFFGTSLANYCGLLVIGRDRFLSDADRDRLRWRSQNVLVAGKPVSIITFDQLLHALTSRVQLVTPKASKRLPAKRAAKKRGAK
jgi:hypothetical protein